MNTAPVDLSPALHVMLMGVAVAFGPLAWMWLRNRGGTPQQRLRALTLVAMFLTFDLVLFGAFTRLTDSGLGCPDWPGCYGNASPVGAAGQIAQAQAQMPTGPVTHAKAWIEMIHRYIATGVGVLIVTLLVATWLERRRGARVGVAWPLATLVWVCLQGAFGALTVTMKLFPAIVTMHLLGGFVLLCLLCAQAARTQAVERIPAGLRALLVATTVLVWVQAALGGWVSTNYAVLACNTFPTCQGAWWPTMDFAQGFELWRALGMTSQGEPITFPALTAIHVAHRTMALAVFVAIAVLVWRLRAERALGVHARWLTGLAVWQFATGLSNVVLGWPLVAALGHTGGAAGLLAVLTWALCASRSTEQVHADQRHAREVSA